MSEPILTSAARLVSTALGLIVACLAVMWAVEIVDTFVLDDRLQAYGIGPRRIDGLTGVVLAPLLHSGFGHLASNSVPFVVLGWLVSLRGRRYWAAITLAATLLGGAATWLLAGGVNHIGASGVVFGYFGALVTGAFYDRRPAVLARAMVAIFLYSSIIVGIVPQEDLSWEGHLFGLIAGALVARRLAEPQTTDADAEGDEPLYDWELDEPWREDG